MNTDQIELTLRGDLDFRLHTGRGGQHFLVEDKLHSHFFQIGVEEYTFLSLLDGRTTIQRATQLTAELHPDFSPADATGICSWLIANSLVTGPRATTPADTPRGVTRAWNPLFWRMRLGNPDRLADAANALFGWLISPAAFVVWLIVVLAAIVQVVPRWNEITDDSGFIWSPHNWLTLLACWVILKVIHESAHALACKRFGGTVGDVGVAFILLAPVPFVDVTSAWRFSSRWHRVFTAAAGMYAELFVAAVAAFVWSSSEPGLVRQSAVNVMLAAGVTTLAFNANPLMRFDGYYILSSAIDIPNLYAHGHSVLTYVGRRLVLNVPAALPDLSRPLIGVAGVYGILAFAWRLVVCVTMIVAAGSMLRGLGIVLSLVAVFTWFVKPLARFLVYLANGNGREQPDRIRSAICGSVAAIIMTAFALWMPWPRRAVAPAVVESAAKQVVRVESPGFVREIRVRPGEVVAAGAVLAVLENPRLTSELADVRVAVNQSRVRQRVMQAAGRIAAARAELAANETLNETLVQRRLELDRLVLRAEAAGRIDIDDPAALLGRWVSRGTELLTIVSSDEKQLRISISQDDLDRFCGDEPFVVDIAGRTMTGQLDGIEPRATTRLPATSLAATSGGPLPVVRTWQSDDVWALARPRFIATVQLPGGQSSELATGMTGTVRANGTGPSIGLVLWTWLRR